MKKRVFLLTVLIMSLSICALHSACNPTAVELCVAADDVADVWINGTYIDTFNYVNWDQTGVFPTCVSVSPALMMETGNVVAMKVRNIRCCEIWGSWSIETTCSDGSHACITSDEAGLRLYRVEGSHTTPPPVDGSGNAWNDMVYTGTGTAPWQDAVKVTGTIYGKLIFDPCTGGRLDPLSWASNSAAQTDDFQTIYMRQPFSLTPVPTLPPAQFTITKAANPTSNIGTNTRVTYTIVICNTGNYTTDIVEMYDDMDDGFSFDGPYGGDCDGYGDGSVCTSSSGGNFTGRWVRGFPGQTCVTITARAVDYWVDSSEYCDYRDNVVGVRWPSPVDWPRSNTVTVQMYCPPTNTFTLTFTPSNTRTQTPTRTFTNTHTSILTSTFTNTFTHTNTFTNTNTPTQTFTRTHTLTYTFSQTYTQTYTPTLTYTPGGPTDTPSHTATNTRTFTNTATYTHTRTFTNTHTYTHTVTNTPTQTNTFTQTFTNTETFTVTATFTPTETPINRFQLAKSINAHEFLMGDTVQYCLTFTNTGIVVSDLHIWDTLPYEVDLLFATGTYNTQTVNIGGYNHTMIYWTLTNVVPGDWGSVCIWSRVARFPHASFGTYEKFALDERKLRAMMSGRPPGSGTEKTARAGP